MAGRRKRGGDGGHSGGDERWLLTYADMITLLLALFIVLFAMSTINAKQFDNLRRSLSQTFKGQVLEEPGAITSGASGVLDPSAANQTTDNSALKAQQQQASNATAKAFQQERQALDDLARDAKGKLSGTIEVEPDERGLVVSIAGDALFASGSYELRPGAEENLIRLAKELAAFNRPLAIEGHTDGVPFTGMRGGNMGLSQARALTVWMLFRAHGVDQSMSAIGQGDMVPKVRPSVRTASVAKNRRVEIHILAPGADDAGVRTASEQHARAAANGADVGAAPHGAAANQIATPASVARPTKSTPKVVANPVSDVLAPIVEVSERP